MTEPRSERQRILEKLDAFLTAWSTANQMNLETLLTAEAMLTSSAHGEVVGKKAIAEKLVDTTLERPALGLFSTNHYVTGHGTSAYVSAYVYGRITSTCGHESRRLVFGATLVLALEQHANAWQISNLRMNVNWLDGDGALLPGWKRPIGNRDWKVGDSVPVIVSEIDSPWLRFPVRSIVGTVKEQIGEVYARYAWGVTDRRNDAGDDRRNGAS